MCHFFSAGPSVSPVRLRAKVAFMSIDHFLKQFTNHVPFLSLTLSWILSFRGILYFLSNTISNRLFTVQFTVDQAFIKMTFFFLPFYYLKMSVYIILKHNQWLYISLIYCCTDIFFYWIECDSFSTEQLEILYAPLFSPNCSGGSKSVYLIDLKSQYASHIPYL